MVEMAFADTGVGMSADTISRIFDPFFSRRADAAEGTGLGLTICRSIVGRYGGTIRAESEPGKGATFTIAMPSADNHAAETTRNA
jgi:signal transduction histidine kinase